MENIDQAERENAFALYCQRAQGDLKGTISAGLTPEFMRRDETKQTSIIAFRTADWMRNPHGTTHGGIVSAMLDTAMGIVVWVNASDRPAYTISMVTNYVLPVPVERLVYVEVAVSRIGGTIAHTTGRLYDPERPEDTLATATGVYHIGGRKS